MSEHTDGYAMWWHTNPRVAPCGHDLHKTRGRVPPTAILKFYSHNATFIKRQFKQTVMCSDSTEDEQRHYEDSTFQRQRPPDEPVDYSPSSGAQDTHTGYNDSAPHSHDGRAQTRTKFYPEEGDDNIDYARLAKLNDGLRENYSEGRKNDAERRRDMKTFCSSVGFTDSDVQRCLYLLQSVEDVRRHESDEVLVLAIMSLVANENDRMIRQEDAFKELSNSCNVTRSQIRNSRGKLRDKL